MTESTPHLEDPNAAMQGRAYVAGAALLWSMSGLFANAPFFKGWPGSVIAFWRALFALAILVPMVRRPRWSWKMIPLMLTFSLMSYAFLTSFKLGSAANAIWLQSTAPVWVTLIGVFVFRETAQARDWLLLLFSVAGVGVILFYESRGTSFNAVLYGLASGLFYAGVVLSLRQLRQFESAWLVTLSHLAASVFLFPFMFNSRESFWPSGIQWPLLLGFGTLQLGLPYLLFSRGLRSIPGHEAAGIGLLEPLLVPLWVYLAWNEVPAWWTMVGGGLILLGLLIRYAGPLWQRRTEMAR